MDVVMFAQRRSVCRPTVERHRHIVPTTMRLISGWTLLLALVGTAGAQVSGQPKNPDPFGKANGAAQEPASTGVTFYYENDMLGFGTDQNYTGGFALSAGGRWIPELGLTGLLTRFNQLSQWRRLYAGSEVSLHSAAIIGSAFTPTREQIGLSEPVRDDRPYASVFGVQTRRVNVGLTRDKSLTKREWALSSELTVGALGLNIAKAVQTDLHRMLRRRSGEATPVDPAGWHNQISNGGEPTLLYRVAAEHILAGAPVIQPGWQKQATWHVQGSAGYYTNAAVGVSGRWGRLASDYWQFNSNPLSSVQQRMDVPGTPWELYLFGGARGRAVAYNALLQGQFRESVHTIDASDVRRLVGEAEFGVSGARRLLGGQTRLTWIVVSTRSPEFSGPLARAHVWGALHLSYAQNLPGPGK
jgi:hypothetical protein